MLAASAPLSGQDDHRIWGRVVTTTGDVYEGFIRWDRNEGSWVDILDGSKEIPEENYEVWLEANADGQRPIRSLELKGYRITWNEDDPEFPSLSASGVRFGHLESLIVTDVDEAEVVLRSGTRLTLSGGSTDLGSSIRELIVADRGGTETELEWEEIERVDFGAVPAGARAESPRLYGTVRDDRGRTYSGYISWDLDEIFESDILDGEDADRNEHEIPFGDIRSIVGHRRSATITLQSGEVLELDDSNDVDRGNRGVQISDPALGMIEVEWDEFESVTFQPAPRSPGSSAYHAFDGGYPLFGTVVTSDGTEIRGHVRWDADEQWSWEFLDGRRDDVSFKIEFANIASIRQDSVLGVQVTTRDGRVIELEEGNDVDWDNRGILVAPAPPVPTTQAPSDTAAAPDEDPARGEEGVPGVDTLPVTESVPETATNPTQPMSQQAGSWHYVFWDDFLEFRLEHPGAETGSESSDHPRGSTP